MHFGALQLNGPHWSVQKIYIPDGRINLEGLTVGAEIRVYDTDGRCYHHSQVEKSTLILDLPSSGVYIIQHK